MLVLDDVGFIKALLLTSLSPSTLTHYMGSRLYIFIVLWRFHALMVGFLTYDSENTPISPDCQTLQVTRLQLIYLYLSKYIMLP
jgi:hypothetical protein